ncbi:MAG: serine protease Do [Cellvibrionaceae bacterium]|jgi:serine protease Do
MQLKSWFSIFSILLTTIIWTLTADARSFPEFTDLIESKSPAVVKITAESKSSTEAQPNQEIPENVPDIFKRFLDPRQAPRRNARASGSGFLISKDGYVLTNNHVVEGATDVVVRLIDRREYDAEVVGTDPQSDLALLKIKENNLPYLKFADSEKARVGEWVLAIGSPFGLDYSVSAGIISAIGRSIPSDGNQNYVPFIQTDVAINPGNSGGPLFNLDGDVVGINSQIYTRSGGSIGLSFAIPSNLASDVVEQLKDNGRVDRGWLGVVIQDVDKDLALSFGLDKPEGALISQMEPNGPAERSGLKVGDIILEFNGRTMATSSDLPYAVGPTRAGSTVSAVVMRKGQRLNIDVTVGTRGKTEEEQVASSQQEAITSRLGLQVEEIPDDVRESNNIAGVLINNVVQDSPAAKAGLQSGDILVQLGFDEVSSVKSFREIEKLLPENKPLPIRVVRRGSPLFRSVIIEN